MLAVLLLNRMRSQRQGSREKQPQPRRKHNLIEVSEQLVDCCRTCLTSNDLVDIFYSEDTAEKRSEDLKVATGVEIKLNDGLSQKMCTKCIDTLNLALQFRFISVKNDNKLRKLFENSNEQFKTEMEEPQYLEYEVLEDNVNDSYHTVDNHAVDQRIEYLKEYINHDFVEIDTTPKDTEKIRPSKKIIPDSEFKCHICGKEYSKKSTYKTHMRTHSYYCICEQCGKRCHCRALLLQHKRAVHGLERIHTCPYCDYTSATKAGLIVHIRRHTGERSFVCEHCGARFHSRGNLLQHLPTHEVETNFECKICQKREKSKRLLQHHYYKVHKEKKLRYVCPVCSAVYKTTSGVRLHLAKTHNVPRKEQPALQRFRISSPDET